MAREEAQSYINTYLQGRRSQAKASYAQAFLYALIDQSPYPSEGYGLSHKEMYRLQGILRARFFDDPRYHPDYREPTEVDFHSGFDEGHP